MYLKYLLCLAILMGGCASQSTETIWRQPRPLVKDFDSYHAPREPETTSQLSQISKQTDILTLRQVLILTLMKNPQLAAFSWQVRMGEAQILQAGLLPNPELSVEVEDFAGEDEREAFDGVEVTIQLSQLIELGGKAAKRVKVASLERDLAVWDYKSKRLEIFVEVTKAFIDVVAAQEQLKLSNEALQLTNKVYNAIAARVESGKVSPIELTKAKIALSTATIRLERGNRNLQTAKEHLASFWGNFTPHFNSAKGDLLSIGNIPSAKEIKHHIFQHPDFVRWKTELAKHKAIVELEDSQQIPDVRGDVGIRFFNETNDQALVAGLSVTLPIFNRNQGNSLKARYQLANAINRSQAAKLRIYSLFIKAYQRLSVSFLEINTLRNKVLPDAQSVFEAVTKGYQQGKFSYLEVLDAQRTFFELKRQYLDKLAAYHKSATDIEGLIGNKLRSVNNSNDKEKRDEK